MKIIKFILAFLAIAILAVVVIGFFLPQTTQVERSISINQSTDKVFAIVNNLSRFSEWSPWHEIDPNTQYEFSGPESGVGAKMSWNSEHKHVGTGTQEIIESDENEKVVIALDFGQQGKPIAQIHTTAQGDSTEVTWKLLSDAEGNIIGKYFNLMLDSMLGPMYEKGLTKLKTVAEAE